MPLLLSIAAIVQLAVVWRLWRIRLLRPFRFFAFHFCAIAIWMFVVIGQSPTSPWRAVTWNVAAVITICSLIAAFLETIHRSLEHYPGQNLKIVLGAYGIITTISAIPGALEPAFNLMRVLLVVQRISGVAVAVGAVALVIVLNFLDPRRRPNVVRHERLMASMAAATAIAAWLNNHGYLRVGSILLYTGNIAFPLLWLWAIRPDGEIDPRPPADPGGLPQAEAAKRVLRGLHEG